jgi:hypothetical protein
VPTTYTMTEALAELKTLSKRLEKKREFVLRNVARNSAVIDPHIKAGGMVEVVGRELQAINDLETRVIRIRSAIMSCNLTNTLTVEGITRSVADWLNWRRYVAASQQALRTRLVATVEDMRSKIMRNEPQRAVHAASAADSADPMKQDMIVSFDEVKLAKDIEQHENIMGALDGRLSVYNATTSIIIPD